MKSEIPNDDPGRLHQLLQEWQVESALPPRFSEQVWRRIDRPDADSIATNPLAALRRSLAQWIVRPSFAFSYAAVLLAAGLFAGFWHAHAASQRVSQTLSARYVQMVDPYQMPRH